MTETNLNDINMTETEYNETIIALKKEYEEQLALKEAENARLKSRIEGEQNKIQEEVKKQEEYLNEYVDIKLFRDSDRYTDDVFVAVNGENCVIKRGEWVKVKRKFALVLEQSEIQDMRAAQLMNSTSFASM